MKSLAIVLQKITMLFLFCILSLNVVFSQEESVDDIIRFVNDESNWEKLGLHILKEDKIYQYVELLGAIRNDNPQLIEKLAQKYHRDYSDFRPSDPNTYYRQNRSRHQFVKHSFINIGSPTSFEFILDKIETSKRQGLRLEKIENKDNEYKIVPDRVTFDLESWIRYYDYFTVLFPCESTIALIDNRLQNHKPKSKDGAECLQEFKKHHRDSNKEFYNKYKEKPVDPQSRIAGLSNYTLNHPLYKARQAAIKSNLELAQRILKETKNLTSINSETKTKLLAAVDELAKVRAIEAVETLAPILLLQSEKEIDGLDKKYFSLRKYPVGVALAEIGIPSIGGLLDEIAKHAGNDSDEYRKIACNVMSSILIKKAIPGFVNEQLIKYKDNELAQIRLAKLLPLLGEEAEKISLLKPQFRIWKSSDGLFETRAKFISIDKKNDVTLEKENGKKTTIELSDLQKSDQNYVKEFITINKK